MKKSYYSYAVFLISFVWMFGRTLTQTIYGDSEWGDFVARIFGAIFLSSILALIFYFIYKSHITKNKLESIDSSYRPSRLYYSVASVLVSVTLLFSIYISYSDVSEKKQVAEAAAKAAEIQ